MKTLRIATAAALALVAAQGAFAGTGYTAVEGTSSGFTLGEPVVQGAARSRADVAAEAATVTRALNSRSGHQGEMERNIAMRPAGTRSRDTVRAEARAAIRQHGPVFEGGESAFVTVPATTAPTTLAGSTGATVAR